MPPREPHRPPAGNEPPVPTTGSGVRPISDAWTCGHTAGAVCAECYRELAAKAHDLAEENIELRHRIERFDSQIAGRLTEIERVLADTIKNLARRP